MALIDFSNGLWVDTDIDGFNDFPALSVRVDLSTGTYTAYGDFTRSTFPTLGTTGGATDATGTNGNDYMVATQAQPNQARGSILNGLAGADQLFGSAGQDFLDGGTGIDIMSGGAGNDIYTVDQASDQVIELPGGGRDSVGSSSINVDLNVYANVENGSLFFNAVPLTLTGTAQANFLSVWQNGAEDTAIGGDGNDTYVVNSGDMVVEAAGAAAGTADLVYSSLFTIDLSSGFYDNVENAAVILTADLHLIGSAVGNRLEGNSGKNIIDGRAGDDIMIGGDGNDTYRVDSAGDSVLETNAAAAGGIDRVFSTVTRTLGDNIEHIVLIGAGAINGNGNALVNYMVGNGANNMLTGFAGNDRIVGGAGHDLINGGVGVDVLTGGVGLDSFVFNTASPSFNRDVITDFVAADDTIRLENAIFTALGAATGTLAAAMFKANVTGTATDADDRIVYNTTTGALIYDVNGSGAGGAFQFATLSSKPTISAADFFVI